MHIRGPVIARGFYLRTTPWRAVAGAATLSDGNDTVELDDVCANQANDTTHRSVAHRVSP